MDGWIDSLMDRQLGFKVGDAYVLCFRPACLPQCTCLYAVYRTIRLSSGTEKLACDCWGICCTATSFLS